MNQMVFMSVLLVFVLLGFAYIVLVMANKEAGIMKTSGQVIAAVIAVVALVVFVYGGSQMGKMGGMNCPGMMGEGKMMKMPGMQKMMPGKMMQQCPKMP
ncbi:hypothetical protein A2311_00465 [candidate division WOR-1 bacterium RIFOXYB2_FULL_48_7]|uniref:Uncharacterized protein n=1 Tax=candidate division WOR-1 bacterium RIFOXYB2_FULL_48_7 TaxID=1802583 RepID=A0A1F4TTM1_UNCSA|nr:MAG: hypothetical protein A2311_00465 [candidate division WOR-1 bacterium RIFOXYB2_FULL_48_7]